MLTARIKKYPHYRERFAEARRLSSEANVQKALDAIDFTDKQVLDAGPCAGALVASRKLKAEIHLRLAKADDQQRFAEYQKPVPQAPMMILAVNGVDILSGRSVAPEIAEAKKQLVLEQENQQLVTALQEEAARAYGQ